VKFKVALRLISKSIRHPDLLLRFNNYKAGLDFLSELRAGSNGCEIELLLVEQSYQSTGIGSRLMENFLKTCSHNTTILVQTQNVLAIEFYAKFGFRVVWKKSLLGVGLWICERKI